MNYLGSTARRIAVQTRIAGAKGMWILHPDPEHHKLSDPPKIWIRKSQLKMKYDPDLKKWDRSQRVLDLVRFTRLSIPSSLNAQTIVNLSHNGVPDQVFEKMMKDNLDEVINPLLDWEGPGANVRLAKAVERTGRCMGSRLIRRAGADARLFNYKIEDDGDDEEDDDDELAADDIANGVKWEKRANGELVERDDISGAPLSLYESTRQMLLAGFSPLHQPVLRQKIESMVKLIIKTHQEKYHIPVKRSVEAFIVPGEATVANCLFTPS